MILFIDRQIEICNGERGGVSPRSVKTLTASEQPGGLRRPARLNHARISILGSTIAVRFKHG